jgi:hypothetical protein
MVKKNRSDVGARIPASYSEDPEYGYPDISRIFLILWKQMMG